jgi:glucosamine--fructose-6-phosphate aminotransferase (isomerizing)
VIVISQSGETADTLAAMREAKRRGARTLGLVNVVGSTIAREDDGGIYLHAGPEIGVAAPGRFRAGGGAAPVSRSSSRGCAPERRVEGRESPGARRAPAQSAEHLDRADEIEDAWPRSSSARATSLPRTRRQRPTARGRAQVKEISYIHAEATRRRDEARPIALIDALMPWVVWRRTTRCSTKVTSSIRR